MRKKSVNETIENVVVADHSFISKFEPYRVDDDFVFPVDKLNLALEMLELEN
jgi:hypothetical protein